LNPSDAFAFLGLGSVATEDVIRQAFRIKLLATHPDLAGESETDNTVRLLEAYQIALEHASPAAFALQVPAPVAPTATTDRQATNSSSTAAAETAIADTQKVWLIDCDTIALACSHEEAFVRVLDVGQSLGAITYLDRQGDLIEVLLRTNLGDTMSLVISFQGRNSWVEAFLTTEVLDRAKHELPSIEDLTELVAHRLITHW
jgi:hypothetical protein